MVFWYYRDAPFRRAQNYATVITAHSLYKINIVLLPAVTEGAHPGNNDFIGLVSGDAAKGVAFVDNPVMNAELLTVPKLGLQIAWESGRLRIEDEMQREPEDSPLPQMALHALRGLFPGTELKGFGFNFNLYYHSTDVLPINEHFTSLSPMGMGIGDSLLDFGWQWTTAHKNGERLDGYFLKVSAPLELAVLHNAHFNRRGKVTEKELKELFAKAYEDTHAVVKSLSLNNPPHVHKS